MVAERTRKRRGMKLRLMRCATKMPISNKTGISGGYIKKLFSKSPFIISSRERCPPQRGQSIPKSCLYAQGSNIMQKRNDELSETAHHSFDKNNFDLVCSGIAHIPDRSCRSSYYSNYNDPVNYIQAGETHANNGHDPTSIELSPSII